MSIKSFLCAPYTKGVLLVSGLSAVTKGGSLTTKFVLQSEGDLVRLQAVEALASTASALVGGIAADLIPRRWLMPFTNGFLFVMAVALAFGGDAIGFYSAYSLAGPLGLLPLSAWFKESKGSQRWPTRLKDGLESGVALVTPLMVQWLLQRFGRVVILLDAASFLVLAIASAASPQQRRESPRSPDLRGAWDYVIGDRRCVTMFIVLNVLFGISDAITGANYKEAGFFASYLAFETAGRIIASLILISRSGVGSRSILLAQSIQHAVLIAVLLPLSCFDTPVEVKAIHAVILGLSSATAWFGLYELLMGDAPDEIAGTCSALLRLGLNLIYLIVKSPLTLVPVGATAYYFRSISMTTTVVALIVLTGLSLYTSMKPKDESDSDDDT